MPSRAATTSSTWLSTEVTIAFSSSLNCYSDSSAVKASLAIDLQRMEEPLLFCCVKRETLDLSESQEAITNSTAFIQLILSN